MSARITELRDALLALVEAHWSPAAPDEVVGDYQYDVMAADLTGRKVLVFADTADSFLSARAADGNDFGFQVWVVERFTDPGRPTRAWVDERVAFLSDLFDLLKEPRRLPYLPAAPAVYPQEAAISTVYDIVELVENKLFVGTINLTLRED